VREFTQVALETLDQIEPGLVALLESGTGPEGDASWMHQVFRAQALIELQPGVIEKPDRAQPSCNPTALG